ncbi:hypothetical protein PM082_008710 [Marasmius tenuissimus]|nr:hypothetical protein PM082_008710 [Marasmius tenuissimus]
MQNFNTPSSNTGPGFLQPMVPTGSQAQQSNPVTNDPNSVETFKQNMQLILEYVMTTQSFARSALSAITNAYHPGSSSTQTQADLASLQQHLHVISDMMRHSGVGALPLLASPSSPLGSSNDSTLGDVQMSQEPLSPPSEEEMLAQATQSIVVLYERLRKGQEAAGVVGSLLGSGQPIQSHMHGVQGVGTPMGLSRPT